MLVISTTLRAIVNSIWGRYLARNAQRSSAVTEMLFNATN